MKMISKDTYPGLQENVTTEEVKDAVFLKTGRHLLEEEAEKILDKYEHFLKNESPLSLYQYIHQNY